ncbi:ATPase, P-type (transporting), HAD superfamily, subfamily IC [Desulfobulbus propionicus DSM 2032]|uniref:ATPase, P-type (Transporting), HAD superfamily, subfamily IC n=1 Tax=Desulfobulbus propionicus (strain ATCC 33891 / DSM 2032 / VKM B-1956 / 1pr3) TaxID=577650 RepID=A0A7U3YN23_DESPD|nr:cation-transporting P-type ATPase [Desulfobulbus propionicus]ADW18263.1 ATPase, P-type (transporting), HAD superfamily, subfamily IC [Desulfobulbus propionicus DSM 2032]
MNDHPLHIGRIPPEQVYAILHSGAEGLASAEVRERLAHVGPNRFEVIDRWKLARTLGRQFTNFLAILLFVAAAICFIAHRINPGEGMGVLGWALVVVALVNALFSFFQEYRAERAMEALKQFLPHMVEVRRQRGLVRLPAEEIVPGDVVILSEGDKVAADLRLIDAKGLLVDNSPLTGESAPVRLVAQAQDKPLVECDNIAFAGCTVLQGTGTGVVFATGLRTRFGRIAQLSQTIRRTTSPLEREVSRMIRILTLIACTMGASFFLYGVASGKPLWMNLVFMMGIIVANVPEGLLPTLTLALVMGSLRMAKKNVLVTSLGAVEALGAVHVICTDKTGTLTQNQLTITRMVAPLTGAALAPEAERSLTRLALAASEVRESGEQLLGDPLDVAVARHWRQTLHGTPHEVRRQVARSFAFDVGKRRSGGIVEDENGPVLVVKGAFEAIAPMLAGVAAGTALDLREQVAACETVMRDMAGQGLRVIAVAHRPLSAAEVASVMPEEATAEPLEHDLLLAGFIGIEDPVRSEVPQAVARCHGAGIEVLMITGDHPATALAVAAKAGIVRPGETAHCTGEQLKGLTVDDLIEQLRQGVRIFARTTPEQKMKIVSALKRMERVVAMTGDGVNDAPALRAADIGIAMGRQGTDVARESAQIILLDDNFASIVDGVEEGRTVFANMKKFTSYVLVSNGPEILPYLLYIVLPVPLALNIIHILSIDLGTDLVPSIGLGQEPADPEVMLQPPRAQGQELLTPALMVRSYCFLGMIEGLWSLLLFFAVLIDGGWRYGTELAVDAPLHRSAVGITLATILLMQIGNLAGRRFEQRSGLDAGLFRNRFLLAGILIQIVLSWAILYWPPLSRALGTGPVAPRFYGLAWLGIVLIFALDYLRKRLVNRRRKG